MTESYYSTVCKFMLDNDERRKSMFATNVALLELNSVFSLTATFQNVPVVYAILRTPTLHNPPNIPLCSLAFSDLFVGCVVRKIYRYFINGTTQSCSRFGCQNKYQYHLTEISVQMISAQVLPCVNSIRGERGYYLPRACRGRTAVRFPANSLHMCCVELALDRTLCSHLGGNGFWDADYPRYLSQRLCHPTGPQ